MTFEEVVITKEIADAMLGHNTNNYRNVKWPVVHRYANAMKAGLWKENGEAIVFDEDGALKDGQHRLLAVLESDAAVKMLVVRGVSRDITTWDEGSTRTTTDKAKAEGLSLNASTIGAAGTIISKFYKDRVSISNDEKFKYCWDHLTNLKNAEALSRCGKNHGIMKKSPCIAAIYCAIELKLIPEETIKAFCTIVNNGMPNGNYIPDAALAMRNTLIEGIKKPNGDGYYKGHSLDKPLFETTWQALNAFNKCRKTRRRFSPDGCGEKILDQLAKAQKAGTA